MFTWLLTFACSPKLNFPATVNNIYDGTTNMYIFLRGFKVGRYPVLLPA